MEKREPKHVIVFREGSKLVADEVEKIRREHRFGVRLVDIAKMFKISTTTVRAIVRNEIWQV